MKKLTAVLSLVVTTLAFAGAPSTTSTTAPAEKKKAAKVVSTRGTSAPKEKEAAPNPTTEPSTGSR